MVTKALDSAFPAFDSDGDAVRLGLSKREYFSIMALQGILASGKFISGHTEFAIQFADDLIAQLNKKNEESNSEEPT